ncbi:MAG: hypothetical protein ACE5LU_24435, partial [Anaerolineae bacterium]
MISRISKSDIRNPKFILLALILLLSGSIPPATHASPLTLVHTTATDFLSGTSDGNIIVTENGGGALELARKPTDRGAWTALPAELPLPMMNHTAILMGNHLFVVGGNSGGFLNTNILRSTVDANGNLGPWRVMPPLPTPYCLGQLGFGAGGYLFVEGARDADCVISNFSTHYVLFSSSVDAQGNMGPWQEVGTLPDFAPNGLPAVSDRVAFAADGYAFLLASQEVGEERQSVVYSAPIGAGGTLGEWTAVTALPKALEGFAVVAYNHHLIVAGGWVWEPKTSEYITEDVMYRAPIYTDGTLGKWSRWGRLPEPLVEHAMTVAGGHLIITVERESGEEPPPLFGAALTSDDSLGPWQPLSDLPVYADASPQLTAASGYIFLTGGDSGRTAVYRLALGANQRIGKWSYYGSSQDVRDLEHLLNYATANGDYLFILSAPEQAETPVYSHHVDVTAPDSLTWTPQPALPGSVDGRLLATHGALYFVGNTNAAEAEARVYRAPITAPGTLGAWESLPTPVSAWGPVDPAANDHRPVQLNVVGDQLLVRTCLDIYTMALDDTGPTGEWILAGQLPLSFPIGCTTGVLVATGDQITYLDGDQVYQATLATDGTLGELRALPGAVLPRYLKDPGTATANGFLFVLDGFKNLGVYAAPVLPSGLADWTVETPLPGYLLNSFGAYATAAGGFLFDFSGEHHDELYRAPLAGSASHGSFTNQFDLG